MNNNEMRQKCNRCKMNLTLDKFNKKRDDTYMKQCIECNEKVAKYKKCEHNKIKSKCKDCGGSELCEHNKRKYTCKDCGGSGVCEHNKLKRVCKDCGGSSICEHDKQRSNCRLCSKDIQKLTIQKMLYSSKTSDKKYNRYDSVNFIDKCFVKNLIEDYPTCYYEDCKVELQYREYNDTLGTLKRLNSDIGHIKSNCVICCLKCNHLDYTLGNTRISSL